MMRTLSSIRWIAGAAILSILPLGTSAQAAETPAQNDPAPAVESVAPSQTAADPGTDLSTAGTPRAGAAPNGAVMKPRLGGRQTNSSGVARRPGMGDLQTPPVQPRTLGMQPQ